MKNPAAVALGRLGGLKGGKVKSEAKAAAARRNGRKGGRAPDLMVVDPEVTHLAETKTLTKREVWCGVGKDPYPDKDWDDPVLAARYAGYFELRGKTPAALTYGNVFRWQAKKWIVTSTAKRTGQTSFVARSYEEAK